jgi:hypothetical protein
MEQTTFEKNHSVKCLQNVILTLRNGLNRNSEHIPLSCAAGFFDKDDT